MAKNLLWVAKIINRFEFICFLRILKIPFAVLQFNKADEMKWNVLLYRGTYSDSNRSENINFPIDLNNPCLPCQTKSNITLKNIESKNRVSLLPYVFGGLSDVQENENLI